MQPKLIEVVSAGRVLERVVLGDASVTCIPDLGGVAWPAGALFDGVTPDLFAEAEAVLPAGVLNSRHGTVQLSFNIFLIEVGGAVILVDAGIGNAKARPDRPAWDGRNGPFIDVLTGLGVPPERVDIVVNTHLHADHVGWNTHLTDRGWEPTFPHARYLVSEIELDLVRARAREEPASSLLHGAYEDSIRPIMSAGRWETVGAPAEIASGLVAESAPGHTPGMLILRLGRGGDELVFLADAIHHPLQLVSPDLSSRFDQDPQRGRDTRRRLLAECAERGSIIAPYHFPAPAFGRIGQHHGRYALRPL